MDELVLDVLPDDAGHLVAVELDDGVLDLDLGSGRHGADGREGLDGSEDGGGSGSAGGQTERGDGAAGRGQEKPGYSSTHCRKREGRREKGRGKIRYRLINRDW